MIKLLVFCFLVTLIFLHCNITQGQKPHDLHIFIKNKANIDTIYALVMKNYTISVVDDANDNVQLTLITPAEGCTLDSPKHQLSWLPNVDDIGRQNLKIAAKDDAGNTDTLNVNFVVVPGNNFCPITVGNRWQYSYEYSDACVNLYGGMKKVGTVDVKILSTERHTDSLFFSFERLESDVQIIINDSADTSNYSTSDTIMMLNLNNKFFYQHDTSWVENSLSMYPYFYVNFPEENLSYDSYNNSDSKLKYSTNKDLYGDKVQYYNDIGMVTAEFYGGLFVCGIDRATYHLVSYKIN